MAQNVKHGRRRLPGSTGRYLQIWETRFALKLAQNVRSLCTSGSGANPTTLTIYASVVVD
jgi:hypothetical protein